MQDTSEAPLISMIIPVYNEINFIGQVLDRIAQAKLPVEIIIVDDGSTDGTREWLLSKSKEGYFTLLTHKENAGKGAALSTGFAYARGRWVIPQDADLECFPEDIHDLLKEALSIEAKGESLYAIYGSRFLNKGNRFWLPTFLANSIINIFFRILYRKKLTDLMTCYKLIPSWIVKKIIPFENSSFEVEAEITAKLVRMGCNIYEMPIRYQFRGYKSGKKIKARHFFSVIRVMFYYFIKRYLSSVPEDTSSVGSRSPNI